MRPVERQERVLGEVERDQEDVPVVPGRGCQSPWHP